MAQCLINCSTPCIYSSWSSHIDLCLYCNYWLVGKKTNLKTIIKAAKIHRRYAKLCTPYWVLQLSRLFESSQFLLVSRKIYLEWVQGRLLWRDKKYLPTNVLLQMWQSWQSSNQSWTSYHLGWIYLPFYSNDRCFPAPQEDSSSLVRGLALQFRKSSSSNHCLIDCTLLWLFCWSDSRQQKV